jgi:hypothetical protein
VPTFPRPLSRELPSRRCSSHRIDSVLNRCLSEDRFREKRLHGADSPSLTLRVGVLLLLGVTALSGCGKPEEITTYTVPTHESLQTPEYLADAAKRKPQPARMIAAIAPQDSSLWFFKLQGPPDAVAARAGEVREFLKSLKFPSETKPEWTLPTSWKETPGNANRHATLILSDDPPLELSVTVLSRGSDKLADQLVNNINRWRGQLDLPHIQVNDLPTRTETIQAGELSITLINIVGKASPKPAMPGGMMPPGMGMPSPHGAAPTDNTPIKESKPGESPFEKPPEWTEVRPKQFQLARFTTGEGEQGAEIAISRAGGDRAANVNRWRGQLGLEPLSGEELNKTSQPFSVGSKMGELFEIIAEDKAILGVMIPDEGQTWFVKLTGSTAVAKTERSRFEAFAKSLKIE